MAVKFDRPDIFRPPSEWRSYYLPLTKGCSNNTCTFCTYYGCKLRMRDLADVKSEIDALSVYMKRGIAVPSVPYTVYAIARQWDSKRVFLQDGDAMVYPMARLKEALHYINECFPRLERIGTFATPQDILRRSNSELKELKELKVSIFYMGVESGDEEVLQKVGKGVSSSQIKEAARKVKEAGIALSVTVILGLGGTERTSEHAIGTARLLSEIDPEFVGALSLTLVPGTPIYEQAQHGKLRLVSPFRSLEELKLIIENANFTNCFFSSMHASNYFAVRGRLPKDKLRMLSELGYILKKRDPAMLRPEFLRGL